MRLVAFYGQNVGGNKVVVEVNEQTVGGNDLIVGVNEQKCRGNKEVVKDKFYE